MPPTSAILRASLPTKSRATERSPAPETRPHPRPDTATTALALRIAQLLHDKQATQIAILDVSGQLVIADYFLLGTVKNTRQAQALARELDGEMKRARGHRRRNTGGMESEDSNWVLLDFDDVVVHLFLAEARAYYSLEDLWADSPRLPFTPAVTAPATADATAAVRGKQVRILPDPDDPPSS